MRFLRLVALFGSVILLVATVAALVNNRSELSQRRDTRAASAAAVARLSVQATVQRARAVVAATSASTAPQDVLTTFGGLAAACVEADGRQTCSGGDFTELDGVRDAAALSAQRLGEPVAIVAAGGGAVLVVAQRDVTVVLRLDVASLVGTSARDEIAALGAEVTIAGGTDAALSGRHIAASTVSEPFDDGAVVVGSVVDARVGWGADSPGLYAILLAFATVLLGLATWSFLRERRHLERRATTDELTGLVNLREFERQSEDAIEMAGRMNLGLCIMLIDLNGFKQINDTLGHQVGDLVLQSCAERLRDAVRDTDLVGRWGGDEFVVLLPGLADASAVRDRAERISSSLSSSPAAGGATISGSIGAALYPRHGRELEDLMHAADEAMYEAKSSGVVHRLAAAIPTSTQPAPPSYGGPERRGAGEPSDDRVANR